MTDIRTSVNNSGGGACCTAALDYAERGWEVFPAPPGEKKSYKSAKHCGGVKWGKTVNPKIIRQNWTRWPSANVAIVTGETSGIFVVEADTAEGHNVDGIASLRALEAEHGTLPETLQAISPSGSVHRYYKHPGAGLKIWNSESFLAPGVDVRGDGGMVIAPPSVKPGVGVYKWKNDLPVADAPDWLIAAVILRPAEHPAGPWASHQQEKGQPQDNDKQDAKQRHASNRDDREPEADPDLIASALEDIPNNDVSWGDWNTVAMAAFRATNGSSVAFEAFDKWSRKSSKYNADTTQAKWEKLRSCPPTHIGAGTIFHMAAQARGTKTFHRGRRDYERLRQIMMGNLDA